jgi:hypothetical protein
MCIHDYIIVLVQLQNYHCFAYLCSLFCWSWIAINE